MNTCRRVRKKLSAFQDDEVRPVEKDAIATHLRSCKGCRREHAALLKACDLLGRLPEIEPAPELSQRILSRSAHVREPSRKQTLVEALQRLSAPAATATLAAAALLAGALLGNSLIKGQFHFTSSPSAALSEPAITLASVQVFDAAPPGSFAESYMNLVVRHQEIRDEK